MRKLLATIILSIAALAMTGCSFERIPPAHAGKVLTSSGFQDEVMEPRRKLIWPFQTLVLLDMSTQTFTEKMTVILSDRLELTFDVRFRARLRDDNEIINAMFNDIKVDKSNPYVGLDVIYRTYAQMIIQNRARVVLNRYSSDEVYQNYALISDELAAEIGPALSGTPLSLENIIINNIKFPDVVTTAIELVKERELDIQREEAQNEIELLKKENERRLAEAEYQTRMTIAETIRDENRTIAEGISDDLLEFRRLEVQRAFAEQAGLDGNFTFIPVEALSTPGASMRVYQQQPNQN